MTMIFNDPEGAEATREEGLVRVAVGFGQGLALYGLSVWDKHFGQNLAVSAFYEALFMICLFLPVATLGGVNRIKIPTLRIWLPAAAAVLALLGAYDALTEVRLAHQHMPQPLLVVMTGVGLFIAHELVAAADAERRWFAAYDRYFDGAWKDGVRLALSVLFVGALWVLLALGAALFDLIGIKLVGQVIGKPWFAFPATATFFAIAVHLTDVRAGLVRGIRTVALTLLSWLSPVMALIGVGFLLALPFTGLAPLWATKSAAGILLGAAAALIILTNATYQDGEGRDHPPLALRWTARVTGLLILPLVLIAAYGLAIRIGQHGLTPDRVVGAACVLVGLCYGGGYAAAAAWPKGWMVPVERTNLIAAHLVLAVLLAIFSPIADPSRLSVSDQIHRLDAGKVSPKDFDYRFLKFDSGRTGTKALAALAARKGDARALDIAERARMAQKDDNRFGPKALPQAERAGVMPVMGGGTLPEAFIRQSWKSDEDPFSDCGRDTGDCRAAIRDLDGDGQAEIAVFAYGGPRGLYGLSNGAWVKLGDLAGQTCGLDDGLKAGQVALAPPERAMQDLLIGKVRLRLAPKGACP